MIILFLIVIALVVGVCKGVYDGWDLGDKLIYSILCSLGGLCIGVFVYLGYMGLVIYLFDTESVKYDEKQVYALQDNNSINGNFFLGSGSVEGEMKYYYMIETGRGLQMQSASANHSFINETDNDTPKVELYKEEFKNDFIQWLSPAWYITEYEFTIPIDSVKQNFNIDLK
ncbi:hypothetical protein [Ornithinibacillus xuwenensis]|uniref:Uncharacterized protein n=1 Tax=Ornithinibacillus xuwenensis TaxID=3144668 RepID=A0ABU9XBX1_9BACI